MMRILFTLIGIIAFMGACRQPVQLTPQGVLSSGQPEAVGIAPDRLGRITKMLEQAVSILRSLEHDLLRQL